MLIEEYFVHLERTFASYPHLTQITLTKEKRALHIGFVKGTATFDRGIQLFLMEFVLTQPRLVKTKYRYHCQNATGKLLFQYDNASHHKTSTFPHHKHVRTARQGERIIAGKPPRIETVLSEITEFVEQPPASGTYRKERS